MKRLFLPLLTTIFASTPAFAQFSFNAAADMDINNIKARSLVQGDLWHTEDTSILPACEFPAGSGKHIAFAGGLWLGGYDGIGTLRVAAASYRSAGLDFYPGPVPASSDSATAFQQAARWNKIWSVTYAEVQQHLQNSTHNTLNTPVNVLRWPARGNAYALDASSLPLTITGTGAPFFDVNNNGTYEALQGDYPRMKGDKMQWWLFNDATWLKKFSQTGKMVFEVAATAWAYKRGTDIDNVIYYGYEVNNKSGATYQALRAGFWADAEIGDGFDDYIWYDSVRRMGVAYNADASDPVYGANLPAAGFMLMEQPGDSYSNRTVSGNMISYQNTFGATGNPANGVDVYNYLSRNRLDGQPYTFSWNNVPLCPALGSQSYDLRMVVNTGGNPMPAQGTLRFAIALVACPDAGGCAAVDLSCLNRIADNAWEVYWKGLPAPNGVEQVAAPQQLRIHPNPANDLVYVNAGASGGLSAVEVLDATGRQVTLSGILQGNGMVLKTSGLTPGLYHIQSTINGQKWSGSFLKQ